MKEISKIRIEKMIYLVRGTKVMLDSDLADRQISRRLHVST